MTNDLLKTWENKKRVVEDVESWNNLPKGPRYGDDSFKISLIQSVAPKFQRCGQKSCGGKNYWESPEALNKAVLAWLVKNWDKVYPEVLDALKEAEVQALKDCQQWVDDMQAKINALSGEADETQSI